MSHGWGNKQPHSVALVKGTSPKLHCERRGTLCVSRRNKIDIVEPNSTRCHCPTSYTAGSGLVNGQPGGYQEPSTVERLSTGPFCPGQNPLPLQILSRGSQNEGVTMEWSDMLNTG